MVSVSSCNLQVEHKGEGDFLNQSTILLKCKTLLIIMYWKALKLLFIFLHGKYINFQSKFESGNEELNVLILFLQTNSNWTTALSGLITNKTN